MQSRRVPIWKTALTVLALVDISGCARSAAEHSQAAVEEHSEPAVVVRVAPAEYRTMEQSVHALGQGEALVDKLAMLTPALEGHVHAILVQQGATVKAGQPIVELDPQLPAADLAEKLASCNAARASLHLLESLPRPEEQRINKLAIEQAVVTLERAQSVLDHLKPLAERNEVSPQHVFDAKKAVEQARLQKESAEAQLSLSMLGPRAEAIEEAKARILIAEQAAQTSQARLDLHTIRAPIDGVLQDLACHPGQTIAAGTSLGEIVDSTQIFVLAWLPARSARLVRVGQKAKISSGVSQPSEVAATGSEDAQADEPALFAEVVFVGQVADAQTGNYPVRCLVDNAEAQLAIGQMVNVSITIHEGTRLLGVPAAAVFDVGEGPVLCVVRDGKSVQLHPRLGISDEGWVAVADTDLQDGEAVVIDGGYNLEDGTPVNVEGARDAQESDDSH